MSYPSRRTCAACCSSLSISVTPTLMLGASMTGMSRAASAIWLLCSALKPVVPITMPTWSRRHTCKCAMVPSGRVKSIRTSLPASACSTWSVICTPHGEPTSSPASLPRNGLSCRSNAACRRISRAWNTASSRVRPIRPELPAIEICRVIIAWACPLAGARCTLVGIGGVLGRQIGGRAQQLVAVEEQGKPLLLFELAAFAIDEHIVPALGMERIGDQRRSQQKTHLRARHAGLQFRNRLLIQEIALLHIDLVRPEEATGQERRTQKHRQ